jgi:Protein of unknown function
MDRRQAVEIQKHLLDADRAMDSARMAIAGLGKEERIRLDGPLMKVGIALRSKLLAAIYDQYPDLEPPSEGREVPTITSRLRWEQVRLPPSVSEADIDAVILSVMIPRWQKVAMVVIRALKRCEELALPISGEALAARIQVLAKSGRLEDIGDLRKWRHSEVRLKD